MSTTKIPGMKTSFYLLLISVLVMFGCRKSNVNPIVTKSGWNLIQKNEAIGANDLILTPSGDSSVLLVLNPDGTYSTDLNGVTVSHGTYSITTDTSYYSEQILQLNDFKTTGLFNLFTLYQIGSNNQVISEYDGLYMNISNDTLTLSSPPTPGGFIAYTFIKK
jgi:hypothetical protein